MTADRAIIAITDSIHRHLRFRSAFGREDRRLVLGQTCLRLWVHRSGDHQPHHLLHDQPIRLFRLPSPVRYRRCRYRECLCGLVNLRITNLTHTLQIPAAFRLILAIFEPKELQVALTLFGEPLSGNYEGQRSRADHLSGLSGAIANVTGLVISGFFGFITAGGQMAAWRWFFRFITIVIAPFAFAASVYTPATKGDRAEEFTPREKFYRLDLIGCLLMFLSIIALILGLTLGATFGFKTADFLVPFLLAWPLFVAFFVWEARLPEGYALIPTTTWKIPNMTLLIFVALGVYPWWAVSPIFCHCHRTQAHDAISSTKSPSSRGSSTSTINHRSSPLSACYLKVSQLSQWQWSFREPHMIPVRNHH